MLFQNVLSYAHMGLKFLARILAFHEEKIIIKIILITGYEEE